MSLLKARIRIPQPFSWIDLILLVGLFLLFYGLLGVAAFWSTPFHASIDIDLSMSSLPRYAFFSVMRGFVAYGFSLGFAIFYGYLAGHYRWAEKILIPLLDILQSVPVLGFLPGVVLALIAIFPRSYLGLELACILMIFTGQVWNMCFSFYSSIKGIPSDFRDMAELYGLSRWEQLKQIEIPFAMHGLLWNSMLSMAGGWFFLVVIESFTLGNRSFRLPGIGSYIITALEQKNLDAFWMGIIVMVMIVVLVDRCLWAPVVVWAERFKIVPFTRTAEDRPLVVRLLDRSHLIRSYYKFTEPLKRRILEQINPTKRKKPRSLSIWIQSLLGAILLGIVAFGFFTVFWASRFLFELWTSTGPLEWWNHFSVTFLTVLRVFAAVVLGSFWTIPVGVWIGTHPKWTRRLQPLVQVAASFPAPMLFPVVAYGLTRMGISFSFVTIILTLLGCQFYMLFNVIAGATQIPHSLREMAGIFKVRGWHLWMSVILPSIFPNLLTGWITAAGGAWNVSIVSEIVRYGEQVYSVDGIGSFITLAAERADFPELAVGVTALVFTIVLINRFVWRNLYQLSETRFRMELE